MNYYFLLPELGRGGAEQVVLQLAHKVKSEGKKVTFEEAYTLAGFS